MNNTEKVLLSAILISFTCAVKYVDSPLVSDIAYGLGMMWAAVFCLYRRPDRKLFAELEVEVAEEEEQIS